MICIGRHAVQPHGIFDMEAIVGDHFAITAIAGCGDEWIGEALTGAGIDWNFESVKPHRWLDDDKKVLFVLRNPVAWYRDYILDVVHGSGAFAEIDDDIKRVFKHLGSEPSVAINIAALNLCAHHPAWLSQQFKMYEFAMLPIRNGTAVMDYNKLESSLKLFIAHCYGSDSLFDWKQTPRLSEYQYSETAPDLFEKTIKDIQREEQACYGQFGKMFEWG